MFGPADPNVTDVVADAPRAPRRGRPAGGGDGAVALERLRRRWAALDDASMAVADTGSPVDVAKVAADLRDAARTLGALDWDELGATAALALTEGLESARRAVTTALAGALESLERTGATVEATGLGVPSWFAHTLGSSRAEGARLVKLGRALARFPRFESAIASGALSIAHGDALAAACNPRNTDTLVAVEAHLIDIAHTSSFPQWLNELRRAAALADADGPTPDSERSTVSLHTVGDTDVLHGNLHGAAGERFRQTLDAELTRQRRHAWRDHKNTGTPMPGTAQLRATALCELVRRGTANPDSASPRTEAVIVIEAPDDLTGQVRALDGRPIPPTIAAQLTCDAHLHALIVDTTGAPLWLGRTHRLATPAQRRALAIRDGGCIFPGCDQPPEHCHAHHLTFWDNGGGTDITNLAHTCGTHHGTAHSQHWTLRPAPPPPDNPDPHTTGPPGPPGQHQRLEWLNHRTGEVIPGGPPV